MHELSVFADFLDLFIIFTFLFSFIIILKQFCYPSKSPRLSRCALYPRRWNLLTSLSPTQVLSQRSTSSRNDFFVRREPLFDLDHDFFAKNLRVSRRGAAGGDEIVDVVRLGRMTALCKPTGGVRGIVACDMARRLVARTISQQIFKAVEQATSLSNVLFRPNRASHILCKPSPTSFLEVRCWMACAQWQAVIRCLHSW